MLNALLVVAAIASANGEIKHMQTTQQIPGYTYGKVPPAPISLADLDKLKKALLLGEDDIKALRRSYDILKGQTDQILDVWYGFVGSHDFLLHFFTNKSDGKPNAEYLQAVRKRFAQWILDTAKADFNQEWLNWQFELGRRHHRTGKNKTDGAAAVDNINFRYVPALAIPITTTLRPFLAKGNATEKEIQAMHEAWVKAVTLQVILWSYPYVKDGDW